MLLMRKTWMFVMALALVAVCSAPASAAPLPGTKGAGDDADKWLSPNPEFVLTINIKQMLGSEVVKDNLPALKNALSTDETLKTLLETAGLDPLKDIDSILISGSLGSAKDAKALTVFKGRFDPQKIHVAMKKVAEKGDHVEVVKEGEKNLYQLKIQDQTFWAGFANKSILVMTRSKESTLETLKTGGTKSATIGKEMKAALNKFTGKESLTLATVINDDLKKQLENIGPQQVARAASKLQTLTASLSFTDSVDLKITGNTSEETAAEQLSKGLSTLKMLAGTLTEGLPRIAGKVVDEIKISAKKQSVVVALTVTKAMIDEARKLVGDK